MRSHGEPDFDFGYDWDKAASLIAARFREYSLNGVGSAVGRILRELLDKYPKDPLQDRIDTRAVERMHSRLFHLVVAATQLPAETVSGVFLGAVRSEGITWYGPELGNKPMPRPH